MLPKTAVFIQALNKQSREKGLISKSWGDVESPNCTGFSIEELQGIDFEKIDFEFLSEDIKKKNIWSRMGDMKKALEHTQRLMEGEINTIKNDVIAEGGTGAAKNDTEDINEQIDDQKLYEKKFAEAEDLDKSRQKKPDGRDKSKDTKDAETLYNKEEYKNRDHGGL